MKIFWALAMALLYSAIVWISSGTISGQDVIETAAVAAIGYAIAHFLSDLATWWDPKEIG